MENLGVYLLPVAGAIAGFMDSIAGGGGLITLPLVTLALGPENFSAAHAIGTNKIVGVAGAAVALWVYAAQGHLRWRAGFIFVLGVGVGSLCGSWVTPFLPPAVFKVLLAVVSPLILWIVWSKDRWIRAEQREHPVKAFSRGHVMSMVATGFACGFYDGAFGPGGGTFMLLGLIFVVQMPLLQALAVSKLANTVSAGTSLVSFAYGGYVHPQLGLLVASGMAFGAFWGARLASRKAAEIVRPVMATAVGLLMIRVLFH